MSSFSSPFLPCFGLQATIISNDDLVCDSAAAVDNTLIGVRDAIIKPLIVEPEGAPREYTISEFVCQGDTG